MNQPWEFDKRFREKRKVNIKQLWENHHEVIRQVALGRNNQEISKVVGLSPNTVSNIRNSPLAREKIEMFTAVLDAQTVDIAKRIHDFAPTALDYLEKIISGEIEVSESLRARYASLHLGRAGYGEVKKISTLNATLSREDIENIKLRSLKAASDAGVIEAEFFEQREISVNSSANGSESKAGL